MVKKVNNTHATTNELFKTLDNIVATNPQINNQITEVRNESNLFVCEVLRFYPVKDICYVKIINTNEYKYAFNTHDILSRNVSLESMVDGDSYTDSEQGNSSYIKPYSTIYGIVAKVRSNNLDDEYCLISCLNYKDSSRLKSTVNNGEIKLTSGDSSISLTDERVNILCPELFINGLPFSNPEFENYNTTDEINNIVSILEKVITKGYFKDSVFYSDSDYSEEIIGEDCKFYFDLNTNNLYCFINSVYVLVTGSGGTGAYVDGSTLVL